MSALSNLRRPRQATLLVGLGVVCFCLVLNSAGAFTPSSSSSSRRMMNDPFGLGLSTTSTRRSLSSTTVRHVFQQRRRSSDDTSTATATGPRVPDRAASQEESPPLLPFVQQERTFSPSSAVDSQQALVYGAAALAVTAGVAVSSSLGLTVADATEFVSHLTTNPQETLQGVLDHVQSMGPVGVIYFGLIYLVAEILCVPATPLTLSAGYLFGLTQGAAVCLLAAAVAASVSFVVGKTLLRSTVEDVLQDNPKFAKLDEAIGREGFKLLLLVRLSPIFPFALSNYLYGASSIDFASYFFGTLLGFAPGTVAYVYTGMVGQALTLGAAGGDSTQPWYIYAASFAGLVTFLKLVTDVASGIVESIDDDTAGGEK